VAPLPAELTKRGMAEQAAGRSLHVADLGGNVRFHAGGLVQPLGEGRSSAHESDEPILEGGADLRRDPVGTARR
jgi:hypothetical protein